MYKFIWFLLLNLILKTTSAFLNLCGATILEGALNYEKNVSKKLKTLFIENETKSKIKYIQRIEESLGTLVQFK